MTDTKPPAPSVDAVFADLHAKLGQPVGVSPWISLDQSMIDLFADVTRDRQFIHIDPARAAAETPFGGTIAHGFLTLSLLVTLSEAACQPLAGQVMSINYGFNKVRFLTPVRAGTQVRGHFALKTATRRSETQILQELAVTVEIEGMDKPALIADWLGLAVFGA